MVPHFIVPFAYGFGEDGSVDVEGKARYDAACEISRRYPVSVFLIAGGMSDVAQRNNATSLADSGRNYLKEQGIQSESILFFPMGYSTATEALAARELLDRHYPSVWRPEHITVVTSEWHVRRVAVACAIILGRGFEKHGCTSILGPQQIRRERRREKFAYLKTLAEALYLKLWYGRKKRIPMVQE